MWCEMLPRSRSRASFAPSSMRLELDPRHPDPHRVRKIVGMLREGAVIAYPTDTVYGIGCDITQKKAVDRVYEIKRIPREQPLAFVCADLGDIARYAVVENPTYRVMRRVLPGPYCFILPATKEVPRLLMMKRKTIGIRVPHHEVPLAIVRELGHPIISTTASADGRALNDPKEIDDMFPQLDLVVDAGFGGTDPTTVVDVTGPVPEITRVGAGPVEGLM